MRAFICWIFFKENELNKVVFNDENNENWPSANNYAEWLKNANLLTDDQWKKINELEIKNNKTRQIMADVQKWFVNEYNLLGKPAKRAWLAKQNELRILERELKVHQYNLDHPKEKLEEHEKQCLLKKIEIGERKIGNCKDELEEITKAYENEKRELCQRLSYIREDLEPFTKDPERAIDPLARQLIIGRKNYYEFWRKFVDIDSDSEPLDDLNDILNEWYDHNKGEGPEPNPYEIYVEEKTDDSLIFVWKPVEQAIGKDKENKEIKGIFLSLLKNHLFNYYGEWYEVSDYNQVGYNKVVVQAEKNIFYNHYWRLLKSQANVIVHHGPPEIAHQEICSCPSYEVYTSRNSFVLEYELNFELWSLKKKDMRTFIEIRDKGVKAIATPIPSDTNITYEAAWLANDQGGFFKKLWEGGKRSFTGMEGMLYLLLSERLKRKHGAWNYTFFNCPSNKNAKKVSEDIENIYFKRVGGWDAARKQNRLGSTKEEFLESKGILKDEMHHFLKTHIKATLKWRGNPIWQGNYWDLYNQMMVTESVSPSGNYVTIEGSGKILCRINELITVKIGGDKNTEGFLSTIITVTTTVAAAVATQGMSVPATMATKTAIGLAGGMSKLATNHLMFTPQYQERKETMTFNEFRHKFLFSKNNPISLDLEYNQELANQYLNKRELKGPMLYSYRNLEHFGSLLIKQNAHQNFYLKASIISWNMIHNAEWFREKIEKGVYIYNEDHQDFYKRKLTVEEGAYSQGGIMRGDWDEFISQTKTGTKILITSDITNADYSNEDYIGSPDSALWNDIKNRFIPHKSLHPGSNPVPNNCLGCLCGGGSHGNPNYRFYNDFTPIAGGEIWLKTRGSGLQKCKVKANEKFIFEARGNTAWIKVEYSETTSIKRKGGTPAGIPPSEQLPTDPNTTNIPTSAPFNPNQFPSSGNLIPSPTGSGEFEPNIPDLDNGPDPDFDQGLDPDFGTDPEDDPTQDPDKPTDPEIPPDTPPDDDND